MSRAWLLGGRSTPPSKEKIQETRGSETKSLRETYNCTTLLPVIHTKVSEISSKKGSKSRTCKAVQECFYVCESEDEETAVQEEEEEEEAKGGGDEDDLDIEMNNANTSLATAENTENLDDSGSTERFSILFDDEMMEETGEIVSPRPKQKHD